VAELPLVPAKRVHVQRRVADRVVPRRGDTQDPGVASKQGRRGSQHNQPLNRTCGFKHPTQCKMTRYLHPFAVQNDHFNLIPLNPRLGGSGTLMLVPISSSSRPLRVRCCVQIHTCRL
jgi:hypothetical protein